MRSGRKKNRGPKQHPGPWESQLWEHLEEIRSLRRSRQKWKDIAATLSAKTPSVKITASALRNFFVRSRDPKLKLPAGLEHLRPPESLPPAILHTPSTHVTPAMDVNAQKESTGQTYENRVEAERQKDKEKLNAPFKTYE